MDYQTAIHGSETILRFILSTYSGQTPPVSFFIVCLGWYFAFVGGDHPHYRMHLEKPRAEPGAWEHRWNTWSPPVQIRGGSSGSADLPQTVQSDMQAMRRQVA